jgi:hypothetical protein
MLIGVLFLPKAHVARAFQGGDGTVSNPYLISNCLMLQDMNNDVTASYKLTTNIDCRDTSNWNDGSGFMPVGDMANHFTGSLDGNSKVINGLTINRNQNWVGLFGVIDEQGSVHDITLSNVNISGGYYDVGALAGVAAGTITNAHSSGNVSGRYSVGGLVGYHTEQSGIGSSSPLVYTWDGTKYVYAADVGHTIPINNKGNDSVAISNEILKPKDNVYNIKISQEYDEIVYYDELALKTYDTTPGYQVTPQLEVAKQDTALTTSKNPTHPATSCVDMFGKNCLSAVSAIDDNWTYKDQATNINTYTLNFGDLSSSSRKILVLNGVRDFSSKSSQSLRYLQVKNASGAWVTVLNKSQLDGLKGAPRSAAIDMSNMFLTNDYSVKIGFDKTQLNYAAMDTSPAQAFDENTYHPNSANLQFRGYTAIDDSGPYWKHDFYDVKSYPSTPFSTPSGNFTKYGDITPLLQNTDNQYVVMHHGDSMDINFTYSPVPEGKERSYVLYSWAEYKHASTDSWSHTVNPLPFQGMSSYPYPNTESYPNTQSNKDYINTWNTRTYTAPESVAHHTIIDSSSSASVEGYYSVGGLVGVNRAKLITGSYATGSVSGNGTTGGLVGSNYNGSTPAQISHSYATGNVTSPGYSVGGLVGENGYSLVDTSYATGSVEGYGYVGGLVGYSYDGGSNQMHDVYATGGVTSSYYGGGLFGVASNIHINNSYASGHVSASEYHGGGLAGLSFNTNFVNSFWDYQTTGLSNGASNGDVGAAKSTSELKNIRTYTDIGFNNSLVDPVYDFTGTQYDDSATNNVWTINATSNSGYPIFASSSSLPNLGDLNADGILDSTQANVKSYVNNVNDKYTSLEVNSTCTPDYSTTSSVSNNASLDSGYLYPAGLMNFTLECPTTGASATITQYFYDLNDKNIVARKYSNLTGVYSQIPGATISQLTIDGHTVTKITYSITDGGALDEDGAANGIIVDPSGPAINMKDLVAPNTGAGSASNKFIIFSALASLLGATVFRILRDKNNEVAK